jgi:hypothetical protein
MDMDVASHARRAKSVHNSASFGGYACSVPLRGESCDGSFDV